LTKMPAKQVEILFILDPQVYLCIVCLKENIVNPDLVFLKLPFEIIIPNITLFNLIGIFIICLTIRL